MSQHLSRLRDILRFRSFKDTARVCCNESYSVPVLQRDIWKFACPSFCNFLSNILNHRQCPYVYILHLQIKFWQTRLLMAGWRSLRVHQAACVRLPPKPYHRADEDTQYDLPQLPPVQELGAESAIQERTGRGILELPRSIWLSHEGQLSPPSFIRRRGTSTRQRLVALVAKAALQGRRM